MTEDRDDRSPAELREYLKQLKFDKKLVGGVDEESALLAIQKVTEIYEAYMGDLHNELDENKKRLEEQLITNGEQRETIRNYEIQMEQLKKQIEQLHLEKQEYHEKNEQMSHLMAEMSLIRESILSQAKARSAQMIADAKRDSSDKMIQGTMELNAAIDEKKRTLENFDQKISALKSDYQNIYTNVLDKLRRMNADINLILMDTTDEQ